jgi:branched-subunit amino acid aminotransferase/4-amino-4-deoxychorismate lyase
MLTYCHLNGQLTPADEARLHISDLGLLRGFGIFDFFLFKNRQPLFLADYLDRFYRSAALLELGPMPARAEMEAYIHELIAANGEPEGGIRLLATGGYSPDGYTPVAPNFFAAQYALPRVAAEEREQGCALLTWQHVRELPEVKSINYLTGILAQRELKRQGAHYLLYHDGRQVLESDRSNFLVLTRDGALATPRHGVLAGITRAKTLDMARQLGMVVEEREVPLDEMAQAREAYLTSSTKGVLPVTRIDGKPVGDGRIGPVGRALAEAWKAHHGG